MTAAQSNLGSYSQSRSVFTKNAPNAPNAPARSELRANTPNAQGARQLHEVILAVTVNLAVFSL